MLCPNCKKEIKDDAKFCEHCGSAINKNVTPVARWSWLRVLIHIASFSFVFSFLFFMYIAATDGVTDQDIVTTVRVVFFVIGILAVSSFSRGLRKHGHLLWVPKFFVRILSVAIALSFIGYLDWHDNATKDTLSIIQEKLTDLTVLKIKADTFSVSKNTSTDWQNTETSVKAISDALTHLSPPAVLKDYRLASIAWSKDLLESTNSSAWKTLDNQPGDFRLVANDNEASTFLRLSISKINELKTLGDTAIKNNDREAMRRIAANLLVQQHWLNGVLHSSAGSLSMNIIPTALAEESNFSKLPGIPEVGTGCPVGTDPRNKETYGKCITTGTAPTQPTGTKQEPIQAPAEKNKLIPVETGDQETDNLNGTGPEEVYQPYTYASAIRKVCFTAYNGKNFCVPEVIEATTNIYKSAVNYANGKVTGTASWDKVWEEAASTAGIEPSIPSVEGGHEIPSEGVISEGEKDVPPPPTPKTTTQTTGSPATALPKTTGSDTWDGIYMNNKDTTTWDTVSCTGNTGRENQQSPGGYYAIVRNNMVYAGGPGKTKAIDSNGFVSYEESDGEYSSVTTWQFYRKDGVAYMDGKDVEHYKGMLFGKEEEMICTRTVTARR